jgi:hypothetical protein
MFSKGWDKPWSSPPNGGGGAPRQGWLNAYEGVFYRLSIATFGWQHGLNGGDGYNNNLISFTPLNQRLQIQTDIPIMTSTPGASGNGSETNFGDFKITPRMILSESRDVTQTLNVTFRPPTGDVFNGNHVAAITPNYQFWANSWKGRVVRGVLQRLRQGDKALAAVDHLHMTPAGEGQAVVKEAVFQHLPGHGDRLALEQSKIMDLSKCPW